MRAMHLCYANSGSDFSTYVWRIESLTPQPVRDRQVKQEKKIAVFSEAEGSVTGRPLESLKANAVAYQDRGWCRAELTLLVRHRKGGAPKAWQIGTPQKGLLWRGAAVCATQHTRGASLDTSRVSRSSWQRTVEVYTQDR